MIPANLKELVSNITRGHPTSPIYAFLAIGGIATNIARHSTVRRIGANRNQAERTGTFYNFIAPSRVGKGIAMSLISELGTHVEDIRDKAYTTRMNNEPRIDPQGNVVSQKTIEQRSAILRPHAVFLTGANGLQTQALAAENAGCGLISVPEIKSGKTRYTDVEGSYAPLMAFYDKPLGSNTYRKAQAIPKASNCRIQIVAAGVKKDWEDFVKRSREDSD